MDSHLNVVPQKNKGFFQKLCWMQRSTKDDIGKLEKKHSVTKTKKISSRDSVWPDVGEPDLEKEIEIQCHEYSERRHRHKHQHHHAKRHRSSKPVTCCEHCPRYQETNPPKFCKQKSSNKRLPYNMAENLPKSSIKVTREPRTEVVRDNLKDMVLNSQTDVESGKKNGRCKYLGRIFCYNISNKKETEDRPVTEMKKISSGHSAKSEKMEPNLTNKTEPLCVNSSECRHYHKSQRIRHHSKHHKLVTQPEISSLAKYFWLWFPCVFSNDNSVINTMKPAKYCENCSRFQDTNPTQFFPQKLSDKELPTSVSDNLPLPSKDDDGKNIKRKVLDSRIDAKKTKAKKKSGKKSDQILGSNKDKQKKIEKTTEKQRVTKNENILSTKINKLSAGYSSGPEMNKTETFSHDHSESHHHHKSQPSNYDTSHFKHDTQPKNNSLLKYFRMWLPFIFNNENSLINTVQPANSCEHCFKFQTKTTPQISQHERLDKNISTSSPGESPKSSVIGRKSSKKSYGKCDQDFRKSVEMREPSLVFERKRSQTIQKVKNCPADFQSEKELLVRNMKEKPYDLVYWFKKEKIEQLEALLNHKRRPLL